jgi:hypothetical protein
MKGLVIVSATANQFERGPEKGPAARVASHLSGHLCQRRRCLKNLELMRRQVFIGGDRGRSHHQKSAPKARGNAQGSAPPRTIATSQHHSGRNRASGSQRYGRIAELLETRKGRSVEDFIASADQTAGRTTASGGWHKLISRTLAVGGVGTCIRQLTFSKWRSR